MSIHTTREQRRQLARDNLNQGTTTDIYMDSRGAEWIEVRA